MPPIAPDAVLAPGSPASAGATYAMASSQSTSRHGSVIRLAHHRARARRSGWRGVAEGEAALDAGVALVGAAVLVRHHPHDLVAAQLGLERAADAAVRAGGEHRAGRHAQLDDGLLLQRRSSGRPARRRRTTRTRSSMKVSPALAETFESKPRPAMVSANVPCISSQARTQREQAMHLLASKSKYGLESSVGGVEVVLAVVAVADLAQADRRRPCPAARSRRWPGRSGSPAGGRRCRAP